jgi:hypothetical protein
MVSILVLAGFIATLVAVAAALNHISLEVGQTFISIIIILLILIPIFAVTTLIDTYHGD